MKLPILKSFEIRCLSLYNQNIKRVVYPGINMIVGGNGIGKTTLVNTLLFALVGNVEYQTLNIRTGKFESLALVSNDYFKGRIQPKDQDKAQVTLALAIENIEISVTRSLYRPRILKIEQKNSVNGTSQIFSNNGDDSELENTYQRIVVQALEIEDFQHFVFIVGNLLIFDEERRTLIWDIELQNDLLRLLVTQQDFYRQFSSLSAEITRLDTEARHKSETRKDINRSIQRWTEQRAKDTKDDNVTSDFVSKEQAELELAKIQTATDNLNDEIARLQEVIDSEEEQFKLLNARSDHLELKKIPLTDQLEELEFQFYSKIYQNVPPDYVLILETLIKDSTCQICGAKNRELSNLGREIKTRGQCIVCRNPVRYADEAQVEGENPDLSNEINIVRSVVEQLDNEQQSCNEALGKTRGEIQKLQGQITQKTREKRILEAKTVELRTKYVRDTGSEPFTDPDHDAWSAKQQEDLTKLTNDIELLYEKRNNTQEELKRLNESLLERLHKINEDLTPIFSEFASKFLGTHCELVISQRTRQRKPVAYLFPRFNEADREQPNKVSESQRFFLDQAFRMALITWFTQKSNLSTFYIVETPEGSLDLAYEGNVADMYVEFGNYGHSILVTSNLNSSNFLKGLYNNLGNEIEKERRTLDLLSYGRLSKVQQDSIREFANKAKQLKLPFHIS